MIEFTIPGRKNICIEHLVLDYNGTLACDGQLIDGVGDLLSQLCSSLSIHILTADTYGTASQQIEPLPCTLIIAPYDNQDEFKLGFIRKLGENKTACIGNGANDRLMLKEAALSIAVLQKEGAAWGAIQAADILCDSILSALEMFVKPTRVTATLRL